MADISEIRELARGLLLMNIANGVIDLADETVSNTEYLYSILRQEAELRAKKKADGIYKGARLPKKEFDESGVISGLRWQLEKLGRIDFRNERQNIIIVGECATGKTSLAVKIAKDAIRKGSVAVYTTEEELVIAANRRNALWNRITRSDLIVIDELFYLKPSEEKLEQLYKTVMYLKETRSIIFVTNRPLYEWDKMSVDTHTVSTFRKRIMADAQLIHLA